MQNELISFSVENCSVKLEISNKEELLKKLDGDDGYLREEMQCLKETLLIQLTMSKNWKKNAEFLE